MEDRKKFGEELGNNLASLSALSPVFSSRIFYTLFVEFQKYLEIPGTDFGDTSHNRRQAPKVEGLNGVLAFTGIG